jgi:hypothetical protein
MQQPVKILSANPSSLAMKSKSHFQADPVFENNTSGGASVRKKTGQSKTKKNTEDSAIPPFQEPKVDDVK